MTDTTVRVEGDVKADLDRLQGLLQAETGERLSQSALLARLIRFARRNEAAFLEEDGEWKPPTREELRRLLSGVRDWGVRTDARNLDRALYGGRK